jgi:hypothetical protein
MAHYWVELVFNHSLSQLPARHQAHDLAVDRSGWPIPTLIPMRPSGTGVSDGGTKGLTVTQTVQRYRESEGLWARAARATHHLPDQGSGRGARHYAGPTGPAVPLSPGSKWGAQERSSGDQNSGEVRERQRPVALRGTVGVACPGRPHKVSQVITGPVRGTGSGWTRGTQHYKSSRVRVRGWVGN